MGNGEKIISEDGMIEIWSGEDDFKECIGNSDYEQGEEHENND